VGGGTSEPKRAGRGGVNAVRNFGGERSLGGDALTEGTVAELRLHDHAEHRVAFGEAVNSGTDGLNGAGKVLTEHDREAVLHHPLEAAARDAEVEAVDRAGRDTDEDLAFARLGSGDFDEGGRCTKIGGGDCFHACSFRALAWIRAGAASGRLARSETFGV